MCLRSWLHIRLMSYLLLLFVTIIILHIIQRVHWLIRPFLLFSFLADELVYNLYQKVLITGPGVPLVLQILVFSLLSTQ